MIRIRQLLLLGAAVVALTGCQGARVGVSTPRALIYKHETVPFTIKRNRGELSQGLVIPQNLNVGRARFYAIALKAPMVGPSSGPIDPLSIGWGDGSLEAAMKDGNIKEVIYGDAEELSILFGIYTKIVMHVYGEPADAPPAEPTTSAPSGG